MRIHDLHVLFDARLFTFREDCRVALAAPSSRLSDAYRRLLRNKPLSDATLRREGATLLLPEFRAR